MGDAFAAEKMPAIGWYLAKKWTVGDKERQRVLHVEIAEKMLKQGRWSRGVSGKPKYKGLKGCRCPIGHALGEHHDVAFEGKSIADPRIQEALRANGVNLKDIDVLDALRWVHDRHAPNVWESGFEFVADMMGIHAVGPSETGNGPIT